MSEQNENTRDVVGMAQKKRHIFLLEKLQKNETLTKSELKELEKFERDGDQQPGIVDSQEQVAKAFEVSARTVSNWIRDGMPTTNDGRYDLKEIQAWRFLKKHQGTRKKRNKSRGDVKDWDEEYRKFKALCQEIRYQELVGEVVNKTKVEDELIQVSLAIKQALTSIPRSIVPQLQGREPREIEQVLSDKINEVIEMFSTNKIFDSTKPDFDEEDLEQEKMSGNIKKNSRNLDRKGQKSVGSSRKSKCV